MLQHAGCYRSRLPVTNRMEIGIYNSLTNFLFLFDSSFIVSLLDSSNELDVIIIIKSLSANPIGRDLAWRYVQTHWDWLNAK